MNDYSVRGRVFRTGNDYQAALRDEKRIELILKRYENADKNGKENILNVLNRGDVKFETLLGDDFLDEIEEIHAEYLSNAAVNDKSKKKMKLAEKKQTKNSANKKKNVSKEKKKTQVKSNKIETEKKSLEDYDPIMQERIKQELYLQEKQRRRTVAICSLVAILCLGYVIFFQFLFY